MTRRHLTRSMAGALAFLACALPSAAVFALPACPAAPFIDNFDPAAVAGWVVDTNLNMLPTSTPWTVTSDPLAKSAANSYKTDTSTVGEKDDRLVAPPQNLTASSHLIFWHKFITEATFDGGVLEVSTNGGNTWVDVVDGGGVFVTGGYNDTIDPGFGSRIAGRPAWTGLSQFANAMNKVEVNLGAYAGPARLFRWRYVGDPVGVGSTGGDSWAIDNVQFTNLQCDNTNPENVCVSPGVTLLWDAIGDATDQQAAHDVRKLSISEPYDAGGAYRIFFHLKVGDLTTPPANTTWPIAFCGPAFSACTDPNVAISATNKYFTARMTTVPSAMVTPGDTVEFQLVKPQASGTATTTVLAETGSAYTTQGLITVAVKASDLGLTPAGIGTQTLSKFLTRVNVNPGATPDNMSDDLVGAGSFTPVGNDACAPNAAPVGVLTGGPQSGNTGMTVNFDASGSHDADVGDSVASYVFNFGDGPDQPAQAGATISHTYNAVGSFSATVKATDSRGKQGAASAPVVVTVVDRPPVGQLLATWPGAPGAGSSPLRVDFDAAGSSDPDTGDGIKSYTFHFGDGSPDVTQTGATLSHSYQHQAPASPGYYPATLTVTDHSDVASAVATAQIPVTPGAPVARVSADPSSVVKGDMVTLDASASFGDTIAQYTFDPGDGSTPVAQAGATLVHAYPLGGHFGATVSIKDTQNTVDGSTAFFVNVSNTAPVPSLGATNTSGPSPLSVSFDASGSSDPDSAKTSDHVVRYDIDFGDGTSSKDNLTPYTNVVHVYGKPGPYMALLRVYDEEGKQSDVDAGLPVNVGDNPPVANLAADTTSGNVGQTIHFNGGASSDPDSGDGVSSYVFDFGDGSTPQTWYAGSDVTDVRHVYTAAGPYTATLKVTDLEGLESPVASLPLTIGSGNRAPVARVVADKEAGGPPLTVTFDASTSADTDGDTIDQYTFDFGDGAPVTRKVSDFGAAAASAEHTYAAAGRYTAFVTVQDSRGATSSNSDSLIITAATPPVQNDATVATPGGAFSPAALLGLTLLGGLRRRRRGLARQ